MPQKIIAKNSVLLFKHEATPGVEVAPSAATDAVLVDGDVTISLNTDLIETNESTGTLDSFAPLVGGMSVSLSFDVLLKGSGVAGTPPEFGKLLQACAWAEIITAAAIPAAPEACNASGGSTTKAVLGTTASSTAALYTGMPLALTGTVAKDTFIAAYDASKGATVTDTLSAAPAATTNYQIPANVLYKPVSTSIPSGTLYLYVSGVLYKFTGCKGEVERSSNNAGVGRLRFTLQGLFGGKSDAAVPAATFVQVRPPVFVSGAALLDRAAVQYKALTLSSGNQLAQAPNPADANGRDVADIIGRKMQGSFDPLDTLVANGNPIADLKAGTLKMLHERYGNVPGNRVALTMPAIQYTNVSPSNDGGYMKNSIPFYATGLNQGAYMCFY